MSSNTFNYSVSEIGVITAQELLVTNNEIRLRDSFRSSDNALISALIETNTSLRTGQVSPNCSLALIANPEIKLTGMLQFQIRGVYDVSNPKDYANGTINIEGVFANGWPTFLLWGNDGIENGIIFSPIEINVPKPITLMTIGNVLRGMLIPFWCKLKQNSFDRNLHELINASSKDLINFVLDCYEDAVQNQTQDDEDEN